jgi:hypothetical protein
MDFGLWFFDGYGWWVGQKVRCHTLTHLIVPSPKNEPLVRWVRVWHLTFWPTHHPYPSKNQSPKSIKASLFKQLVHVFLRSSFIIIMRSLKCNPHRPLTKKRAQKTKNECVANNSIFLFDRVTSEFLALILFLRLFVTVHNE